MEATKVKESVIKGYSQIAKRTDGGLMSKFFSCCDPTKIAADISEQIGYTSEALESVPEGANMGIGCGNPLALAKIKKGDTVLDLGSGAGFDCFLASVEVGQTGKVIGVDLTDEMLKRARKNAQSGGYQNVEFMKGDIETLPLENDSVDIIISNCVLNLSTQKEKVFKEAYRVLRDEGELYISDIVLEEELPHYLKESAAGYVACVAGAEKIENYFKYAEEAGFSDLKVETKNALPFELIMNDPIAKQIVKELDLNDEQIDKISKSVSSITMTARK